MSDFFELSLDLQLILVAGYLAYKVLMMGRGTVDRTEDLIFKVITFGLIGQAASGFIAQLPDLDPAILGTLTTPLGRGILAVGIAITCAALWRRAGSTMVSSVMRKLGVYRDDHESSAWLSATNANAEWNHVNIHLKDGRILQSEFISLPVSRPTHPITVADDGVLMYTTDIIRADGTPFEPGDFEDDVYSTATFIPIDEIKQMDIGWRRKAS